MFVKRKLYIVISLLIIGSAAMAASTSDLLQKLTQAQSIIETNSEGYSDRDITALSELLDAVLQHGFGAMNESGDDHY